MRQTITVIKQDPSGHETWRYDGQVLTRREDEIVIEAFFDREDIDFHGICLCRGDRFVETYYTNRWYNIYEIFDAAGHRKGWYCNVTTPAEINMKHIAYRDLALDLLVFPNGRQLILDEDEFAALEIPTDWRKAARQALSELQSRFKSNEQRATK